MNNDQQIKELVKEKYAAIALQDKTAMQLPVVALQDVAPAKCTI